MPDLESAAAGGLSSTAAASGQEPAALPSPVPGDDGDNTSIPKGTLEKIVLVRLHTAVRPARLFSRFSSRVF